MMSELDPPIRASFHKAMPTVETHIGPHKNRRSVALKSIGCSIQSSSFQQLARGDVATLHAQLALAHWLRAETVQIGLFCFVKSEMVS